MTYRNRPLRSGTGFVLTGTRSQECSETRRGRRSHIIINDGRLQRPARTAACLCHPRPCLAVRVTSVANVRHELPNPRQLSHIQGLLRGPGRRRPCPRQWLGQGRYVLVIGDGVPFGVRRGISGRRSEANVQRCSSRSCLERPGRRGGNIHRGAVTIHRITSDASSGHVMPRSFCTGT